MTQTFNDIKVQGTADVVQLTVQAAATQVTNAIQAWQDTSANPLARLTGDGRLQIGNGIAVGSADALIQASYNPSGAMPTSVLHAPGVVTTAGTVSTPINWVYQEVQVAGSATLNSVHSGLYTKLTNATTGNASGAELRGATFQAISTTGGSATPTGKLTGLRAMTSNANGAALNTAVGVEAALTNDTGGSISQATAFSVVAPINNGTIGRLYGLQIADLTQGTANYALYTGKGAAHLGDILEVPVQNTTPPGVPPLNFVQVYTKQSGTANPQLYGKNNAGIEFPLGSAANLSSPPPIGDVTPNVGTFTTLTSTNAILNGGAINGTPIGQTTRSTGAFSSVAINQSSPTAKLHIKDSGTPQAIIESTSAATTWLEFRDGNAAQHRMVIAMGLTTPTDGKFGIYDAVNAAQRLSIDTNGRIGINQVTPAAMLEVDINTSSTKGLIIKGAAGQANNLQDWQNSSGTQLAAVDANGIMYNRGIATTYNGNAASTFYNIDNTESDINWVINSALRWQVYVYGNGANSNWTVRAFSATGAYLGNWLSIDNSTGTVYLSGNLSTAAVIDNSAALVASSTPSTVTISYSPGSTSHVGNIIITTTGLVEPQGLGNFTFAFSYGNMPAIVISVIGQNTYGVIVSARFPSYFQLVNTTNIPAGQTITVAYVVMGAHA